MACLTPFPLPQLYKSFFQKVKLVASVCTYVCLAFYSANMCSEHMAGIKDVEYATIFQREGSGPWTSLHGEGADRPTQGLSVEIHT